LSRQRNVFLSVKLATREEIMRKFLFCLFLGCISIQPSHAYNNNWVPYALGGLIAGAVIERVYNTPATRYVVQPQPVYIPTPIYVPPTYAPPPTYVPTYAPPLMQRPYQPQASVLYFCGANGLYYPQTPICSSSWQVLPNF
jgi:hypothetical protein